MGKLLFDEQPIVIDRELAKLIGLNESIALQQIHYWIESNRKTGKNFREGRYWTYNSVEKWHEDNFPFWSLDTIRRTFSSLSNKGLLFVSEFNRSRLDHTKWYSINYEFIETYANSISAKCVNRFMQNAEMDLSILHNAIPETNKEINTEIKQQQTDETVKTEKPVVVSEAENKSEVHKPKPKTAPDVSSLSFIVELTDMDKVNILKKTGNDVPSIHAAYELAQQQGGIQRLTGFLIEMTGKFQRGEVSPPVNIKRQTVNRFNNSSLKHNYNVDELERLEQEQLRDLAGEETEEEFENCFADV